MNTLAVENPDHPVFTARLALGLALLAGGVLGAAPFAAAVDMPWLLAALTGFCACVLFVKLRKLAIVSGNRPRVPDLLLAGANATFIMGAMGFAGLGVYLLAYGGWWLFATVAGWLGAAIETPPLIVARWAGAATTLILTPAAMSSLVEELRGSFFSPVPGLRPAYGARLYDRKWWREALTMVFAAVISAATLIFFLGWDQFGVALAAQCLLTYATVGANAGHRQDRARNPAAEAATEALTKMLAAIGYMVVRSPRVGDPSVDQVLETLDLFARRDDGALVVKVLAGDAAPADRQSEALLLSLAARTLATRLAPTGLTGGATAVLVLVGPPADAALWATGATDGIEIVEIAGATVLDRVKGASPEELQHIAREYLDFADPGTGVESGVAA